MRAVILAGGFGSRLSEETDSRPKPMIEIGNRPILWHIMKMYSNYGINEFIICCGYKGYVIKEYFSNYFLHQSDVTFRMSDNSIEVHTERAEPWTVTLVDTGETAMTGGRLAAVASYLSQDDCFCFTYGDGVSDVDLAELIKFHKSHGKKATVTGVYPPGRFGALDVEIDVVTGFSEKPKGDGGMINGGFFVLSPEVLHLIDGPQCVWEKGPLEALALSGELKVFEHSGFWMPMDTLRDKLFLEDLWSSKKAPWKSWE